MSRRHLLIVYHSQSGSTAAMAEAVIRGAGNPLVQGVELRVREALEATVEDVRWADGIILGTPENFGYMSGALKTFFDRIYHPCLGESEGLPWCLFVRAGNDGSGAVGSIERIVTGLRWQRVQPPLVIAGNAESGDYLPRCEELGLTMAAGLEAGVF
jgi:multimeric flavodoxin WrbA